MPGATARSREHGFELLEYLLDSFTMLVNAHGCGACPRRKSGKDIIGRICHTVEGHRRWLCWSLLSTFTAERGISDREYWRQR